MKPVTALLLLAAALAPLGAAAQKAGSTKPEAKKAETQPHGTAPGDRSWYFGQFVGQVVSQAEKTSIRLRCPGPTVCEYSFVHTPPGSKRPKPSRAEGLQVLDHDIANKDLAQLRAAVKAHPGAYADENDGPLLRELKPVLESAATFDLCVGLSDWTSPWGRLCRLAPESAALPPVVLLLPTQGSECKGENFCKYYFFPLRKPAAS